MKAYLIEGLDCSGKKTIARIVEAKLKGAGINCEICIGPLYGGLLKKIDDFLVSLTYKKTSKTSLWFRKKVYSIEPVLDGVLYKDPNNILVIKISSHYRTWAKAILDNDKTMHKYFEKHKSKCYGYSGASYITTSFKTRLIRHNKDVKDNKTFKIASKRFLDFNWEKFEMWDNLTRNLLKENIHNVKVIENEENVNQAAMDVFNHIMEIINHERNCNC